MVFFKKLEDKALCDIICRESYAVRLNNFYKIIELIDNSTCTKDVLDDTQNSALKNNNKLNAANIIKKEGIYGRTFDKYILLKYEFLSQDNSVLLSGYSNLSIEHVLPQNPNDNSRWINDFTPEEREMRTHNIANLILINGRKNSTLSNFDFTDKKTKLNGKIESIFKGSSEILYENEWKLEVLENRLKNICNKLSELETK